MSKKEAPRLPFFVPFYGDYYVPEHSLRLRSVRGQIEELCHSIKALEGHAAPALAYAETLLASAASWRERYPYLAVVMNPNVYHDIDGMIALEAWKKRSHLDVHIDISCMRNGLANFAPVQFQTTERTKSALDTFDKKAEVRFIVVPTRIETISHPAVHERVLAENEFDFNLSATLWVLTSHARRWEGEREHVHFAALGESFKATKGASTTPVAGFKSGHRYVGTRPEHELRNYHVLTGLVL